MSTQYIGRISLKHVAYPGKNVEDFAREACLIFSSEVSASAPCFVFEYGSANEEPHLHFYFESAKSLSKCQSALKKAFELPPRVGWVLECCGYVGCRACSKKKIEHTYMLIFFFFFVFFFCRRTPSRRRTPPSWRTTSSTSPRASRASGAIAWLWCSRAPRRGCGR